MRALSFSYIGSSPEFTPQYGLVKKHIGSDHDNIRIYAFGRHRLWVLTQLGPLWRRVGTIRYDVREWCERLNLPYYWTKFKLALTGQYAPYYVNLYDVDRRYGGGEEGGWYWTSYIPTQEVPRNSYACDTIEEARAAQEWLNSTLAPYQPRHNRYSVLGGPDVEACIEQHPPMVQPTSRPRYE
jgi:hypothetical protein